MALKTEVTNQLQIAGKTARVEGLVPGIGTAAAYASGDAFGTVMVLEFPESGIIESARFIDLDNEGVNKELWLFTAEIAGSADNAVFAPTDEELLHIEAIILFDTWRTANLNQVGAEDSLAISYSAPRRTLWGQFVTRGADNIGAGNIPRFSLRIMAD